MNLVSSVCLISVVLKSYLYQFRKTTKILESFDLRELIWDHFCLSLKQNPNISNFLDWLCSITKPLIITLKCYDMLSHGFSIIKLGFSGSLLLSSKERKMWTLTTMVNRLVWKKTFWSSSLTFYNFFLSSFN